MRWTEWHHGRRSERRAATCLAAHHPVESGGVEVTEAGQGDSEASGLYCVGWHQHLLPGINKVL